MSMTVPLKPYQNHGHRSLDVSAGGEASEFLFDTGGGITLITPQIAEKLKCAPFGRLVGYRMKGERINFQRCDNVTLTINGQNIVHEAVGLFDLNALLPPKWPKLGGMLTLSSFEGKMLTLNLAAGKLKISEGSLSEKNSAPLKVVRQASGFSIVVLVPVNTSKGTLWLELDSGSDAPLLLAPHAAKLLGMPQPASKRSEVVLNFHNVGAIRTPAKSVDMIYDGNIGAPLIARFRWILDLKNQRVRIEPL